MQRILSARLPLDRVAYIHMAGHEQVEPDLIIDTHGQPIVDPVYELFDWTIQQNGSGSGSAGTGLQFSMSWISFRQN